MLLFEERLCDTFLEIRDIMMSTVNVTVTFRLSNFNIVLSSLREKDILCATYLV